MSQPPADNLAALQLHAINKVYRLYRKPLYRVLDLFGLCPPGEAFYSEHIALQNIDLSINRGEKVAIIGRNGAGKSTLLKTITGVLRPTNGTLEVHGRINALLQIGTGFHPDFTGRQNAYSSMAHQGITGREADEKFDEIVDFAELEEFIDQPMKTYSTGMAARLMFSAAVVIEPDILIVDEVLGVGDAYFTHKSFQRMRDLCAAHGTTLLLVSHDIYSAMNLCDRFIWIDKGQVKFDGDAKTAVARYEASVKQQEEDRLRSRSVIKLERERPSASRLHVLLRSRSGFALPAPLAVERIELHFDAGEPAVLDLAQGSADWQLLPEGNLGPPETVEGVECRALTATGSIYHKVEWSVALPPERTLREAKLRWHYPGEDTADVRIFTDTGQVLAKAQLREGQGWQESVLPIQEPGDLDAAEQTEYGTGLARVTSVQFLDAEGAPLLRARHGEALRLRLGIRLSPALPQRAVTLLVGFNRPGLPYGGYAYRNRLAFADEGEAFFVDVLLDPLLLGSGQWMMTYAIGEPDMYRSSSLPYFSVNNKWYHFIPRGAELEVESTTRIDKSGCFMVHPAQIAVQVQPVSPAPQAENAISRERLTDHADITPATR